MSNNTSSNTAVESAHASVVITPQAVSTDSSGSDSKAGSPESVSSTAATTPNALSKTPTHDDKEASVRRLMEKAHALTIGDSVGQNEAELTKDLAYMVENMVKLLGVQKVGREILIKSLAYMSDGGKSFNAVRKALHKARVERRDDILREQAEKEPVRVSEEAGTDTSKAAAQSTADNDAMGSEDQVAAVPKTAVNKGHVTNGAHMLKANDEGGKPKLDNNKKFAYRGKRNQNRGYYAKKKATKSHTTGTDNKASDKDENKENMQPAEEDAAYVNSATAMLQ